MRMRRRKVQSDPSSKHAAAGPRACDTNGNATSDKPQPARADNAHGAVCSLVDAARVGDQTGRVMTPNERRDMPWIVLFGFAVLMTIIIAVIMVQ